MSKLAFVDDALAKVDELGTVGAMKWLADQMEDNNQTREMMAACLDMVRGELIEAGIIEKSVPPMMITEAVIRFIQKDREARDAEVSA